MAQDQDLLSTDKSFEDMTPQDLAGEMFGIDPDLVVEIDNEEIGEKAKTEAQRIIEEMFRGQLSNDFLRRNPVLQKRIETDLESLRVLIKMRKQNEILLDLAVRTAGINSSNAGVYRSVTSLQTAQLNIQKQMDTTIESLRKTVKNSQLEFNFSPQATQMSLGAVADDGSVTNRGSKDFIRQMQGDNVANGA